MAPLYQTEAERARHVPAGAGWPGLSVWDAVATRARSATTGQPFGKKAWRAAGMEGSGQVLRDARALILRSDAAPPEPTAPEPRAAAPSFAAPSFAGTPDAFDRLGQPPPPPEPAPAPVSQAGRVRLAVAPDNADPAVSGEDVYGRFERVSERALAEHYGQPYGYCRVDVDDPLPVALVNLSDLHLGNRGTDHRRARRDAEIVRDTPGMYAVFGGDGIDNFIKHASAMVSSTSNPEEEYAALEWYLGLLDGKLLGGITGNHDYWTKGFSGVDHLRDVFRRLGPGRSPVPYGRHTLRLDLRLHSSRAEVPYRAELRHTFRFKSSLNLSNQLQRMYDFSEWQWDLGMVGHTHDGPFCVPFNRHGAERWGFLAGSYKVADDHSRQWGYNDATPSSPVAILFPEERRIEAVNDLRRGAERIAAIRAHRRAA